jgi:hypothetical protein
MYISPNSPSNATVALLDMEELALVLNKARFPGRVPPCIARSQLGFGPSVGLGRASRARHVLCRVLAANAATGADISGHVIRKKSRTYARNGIWHNQDIHRSSKPITGTYEDPLVRLQQARPIRLTAVTAR